MQLHETAEFKRLVASEQRKADWKQWGPYVSDRAWGTVREDYSPDGEAWRYFPHDHARSRAYRWNEDGIAGVCNRFQNICLAVAFWNERDPFLKERFFGLAGPEGNHGEDVKEYYYYLDSTPTHSYMKMLYKYPQVEFPYAELVEAQRHRSKLDPEVELIDILGDVFSQGHYFDIYVEYAKADQQDILCRIRAINRSDRSAPLHILPHIWYRNTWSWQRKPRPVLKLIDSRTIATTHRHLGDRFFYARAADDTHGAFYFTENDTNCERLFGVPNPTPYVKDGIDAAVVRGERDRCNPAQQGSKAAAQFRFLVRPGQQVEVQFRFAREKFEQPFQNFNEVFDQRIAEADEFYNALHASEMTEDERRVQRQAFAGLMWSKQFYHYAIDLWLDGDPAMPKPDPARKAIRNSGWRHMYCLDVLSMPDKWEYPWFAAWDLAFHCLSIALIDPEWAKRQLILILREWYMHPNGQIPAYEWAFDDVNPPVHAWAAWRVYNITKAITGKADTRFLESVFHKLLLNFTWWVNRKDRDGKNIFEGGFLGLDNIGLFDRSVPLPTGERLEQADGTAWMAMYCLNMLTIALELARTQPAYEDVATKFFEHFIYIADAMTHMGTDRRGLWNEEDGFFYDVLHHSDGRSTPLRIRSFVGLIPLFAVATIDADVLEHLPHFRKRMQWFLKYRPQLTQNIASLSEPGQQGRLLLAIANREKLTRVLSYMVNPGTFLSDYGLRSLSQEHRDHPYVGTIDGHVYQVNYDPADSTSGLFGGNSNWRGPIWFPLNYLMLEALQTYDEYYGSDLTIPFSPSPTGQATLAGVATEIARRLTRLFLRDEHGRRAVFGDVELFQNHPHWKDNLLFYEYFDGDTGRGLGASHQTGWTALVANLLQHLAGHNLCLTFSWSR